jgi:hypothetical protein
MTPKSGAPMPSMPGYYQTDSSYGIRQEILISLSYFLLQKKSSTAKLVLNKYLFDSLDFLY